MSDINCVVCGEPWNAWGVNHGDMEKWEAALFKKGAGCPCCQGERPGGGGFHPEKISDIDNGDEDPIERLHAYEASVEGRAPKWEKPAPTTLWECEGCGVKVIREYGSEDVEYDQRRHSKWPSSHNYTSGCPEEEPAHVFGERKVCEFCVKTCPRCKERQISVTLEFDDVYDDGYAFAVDQETICVDCLETHCSTCGYFYDDDREERCEDCGCGPEVVEVVVEVTRRWVVKVKARDTEDETFEAAREELDEDERPIFEEFEAWKEGEEDEP